MDMARTPRQIFPIPIPIPNPYAYERKWGLPSRATVMGHFGHLADTGHICRSGARLRISCTNAAWATRQGYQIRAIVPPMAMMERSLLIGRLPSVPKWMGMLVVNAGGRSPSCGGGEEQSLHGWLESKT